MPNKAHKPDFEKIDPEKTAPNLERGKFVEINLSISPKKDTYHTI